MKGIVFTEFVEMVEDDFSVEVAEKMLAAKPLPSGGAYTAVGTYDHAEIVSMVGILSEITDRPPTALIGAFGHRLFGRLATGHPAIAASGTNLFDFLEGIETTIHHEVRKLYPGAELPQFDCLRIGPDVLRMDYRSSRPFADLAEGLILGAAEFFGIAIEVKRIPLDIDSARACRFLVRRAG